MTDRCVGEQVVTEGREVGRQCRRGTAHDTPALSRLFWLQAGDPCLHSSTCLRDPQNGRTMEWPVVVSPSQAGTGGGGLGESNGWSDRRRWGKQCIADPAQFI